MRLCRPIGPSALVWVLTLAASALTAPAPPQTILHGHHDAFYDPRIGGGSMTTRVSRTPWPGEPLNVIVSGHSHPSVLSERGLLAWAASLRFEPECAGLHFGEPQRAALGDGHGWLDEQLEIRQARFLPVVVRRRDVAQRRSDAVSGDVHRVGAGRQSFQSLESDGLFGGLGRVVSGGVGGAQRGERPRDRAERIRSRSRYICRVGCAEFFMACVRRTSGSG